MIAKGSCASPIPVIRATVLYRLLQHARHQMSGIADGRLQDKRLRRVLRSWSTCVNASMKRGFTCTTACGEGYLDSASCLRGGFGWHGFGYEWHGPHRSRANGFWAAHCDSGVAKWIDYRSDHLHQRLCWPHQLFGGNDGRASLLDGSAQSGWHLGTKQSLWDAGGFVNDVHLQCRFADLCHLDGLGAGRHQCLCDFALWYQRHDQREWSRRRRHWLGQSRACWARGRKYVAVAHSWGHRDHVRFQSLEGPRFMARDQFEISFHERRWGPQRLLR